MDNFDMMAGSSQLSTSEVMQRIDRNARGILFLKDERGVLIGCVTDGDIRRFLLDGGKMSDNIMLAANSRPKFARTLTEAKLLYHEGDFTAIPLVDEEGKITDIYIGDEQDTEKSKKRATLNIPVVINAGGRGSRLDPFTRVLPKPLIPVGNFPIIEHIMQEYQSYDCNEFHIIVNYKRELIKAYFADSGKHYNITWYDEMFPLDTGGGLSILRGELKDTFFFANCDALLTANYESILKFHKENGNIITMVCAYKNINIPYGIVEMGINGTIKEMREKPLMSFLTNTGIYLVEPEVIEGMEANVPIGFPDVVERERKKGKKVAVFPVSEKEWMDMGQISELEKMRIRLYGE